MNASFSRIKAELAEPSDERLSELISHINHNINPPAPVQPSDVHIRAMYIVSDEVNSFGGRFPTEELDRLSELLVDSPVLVGHRKDRLPVARTFHAEIITRNEKTWVKSYFYWLRSAKGASDLKENIDGGIYKECSIGFTYLTPECSVCGKDIRSCRHEPFEKYPSTEDGQVCHFNYREIERVLETSLVYRGAVPETSISRELQSGDTVHAAQAATLIDNPAMLDPTAEYLVVPHYDGIEVVVDCHEGALSLSSTEGEPIAGKSIDDFSTDGLPEMQGVNGILIGFRGKERCSVSDLEKYLNDRSGPVTRVELRLLPQEGVNLAAVEAKQSSSVKEIRHAYTGVSGLVECASRMKTKGGVRLYRKDQLPPGHGGYIYHPAERTDEACGYFSLFGVPESKDAVLCLFRGGKTHQFILKQFHFGRFAKGARFIADEVDPRSTESCTLIAGGELLKARVCDNSLLLKVAGNIEGVLVVSPVKINGTQRCLIYRSTDSKTINADSEKHGSDRL